MTLPAAASRADRVFAWSLTSSMLLLVFLPLLSRPREDSFPLSTYPMFSRPRKHLTVIEVLVQQPDRVVQRLPAALVGGGEPLQAHAVLRDTARQGQMALEALCALLATRYRASMGEPLNRNVGHLRIVRSRVNALDYYQLTPATPPRSLTRKQQLLAVCPLSGDLRQ